MISMLARELDRIVREGSAAVQVKVGDREQAVNVVQPGEGV
jgi:hypothetical protein